MVLLDGCPYYASIGGHTVQSDIGGFYLIIYCLFCFVFVNTCYLLLIIYEVKKSVLILNKTKQKKIHVTSI